MAEQNGKTDAEKREKISFELDSDTAASLRGFARLEHRTLSAQLRVIVEDYVADQQEGAA